jgi:hypothetical protein
MDGSVDKNTELRSSLLYFVDEAIGYRHSLHFFHRWLETGKQSELEGLIIEVGRENFVDLHSIINTIKDPECHAGFGVIDDIARIKGLHVPTEWVNGNEVKLTPLTVANPNHPTLFELCNWTNDNATKIANPAAVICKAHSLLHESRTNFYKVFNLMEVLFGLNTIFSCVIDSNINRTGQAISHYYPTQADYITRLASTISNNPDLNWKDALSRNQVKSKLWLIDRLNKLEVFAKKQSINDAETTTLVVGGWVGMIPFLASMSQLNLGNVINIDIDTSVHSAAHELNTNTHSNFKNSGTDVREVDLTKYKNPLVIDTIVEHFENHGKWVKTLPKGTTVVLQGNDMFNVPDHVNCHTTLEDFIGSCGLNNIIWAGELNLHMCTRYMAIGTT